MLPLADGDQLLLYTDGVTEARDHGREFYGLAEGLARHVSDEPASTLAALEAELQTHVGGRLHDDAALLLLRKPLAPDRAPEVATGGGSVTLPSPPRPPAAARVWAAARPRSSPAGTVQCRANWSRVG